MWGKYAVYIWLQFSCVEWVDCSHLCIFRAVCRHNENHFQNKNINQSTAGKGKLRPGCWMRHVLLFNLAGQTFSNYVIIYIIIKPLPFPSNPHISPIDGVEEAKSIWAFLHDFYMSLTLVHTLYLFALDPAPLLQLEIVACESKS